MAQRYRIQRDDKIDLKRTQSSFSDDPKLNKSKQVSRRKDNVKNVNVGIYDIDLAFKSFLEKDVKPLIEENGKFIPVPVMYASPENWASAQREGFLRDNNGKVQTPLISFKRNSLDINTEYSKLKVMTDEDTSQSFGAEQNGKLAGMLSDVGTFSFQKTKNINTFEGGMICVPKNSKLDASKIRAICNQGQTSKYHHEYLGFNFRLAEPLCLMAYSQMKLHMTGIKSELGLRGPKDGHYPYVVYDQPAIKRLGITGDCPIAEAKAKFINENYFKPKKVWTKREN